MCSRNHRTSIPSELKTISRLNTSGNSFVSSTEDQLRTHQQTLEHWLLNAVIHTFAKFSSSHKSPCAPSVLNQGFPTPIDRSSLPTDPAKSPKIRSSSSQFRK
ncbi:unnamed protein product [Schistosoma curassoni]|uniref:Uncharacterized protein n=1 Tax=Schistosoma curassoni TaxID=6186 RepID=A0A183KRE0_9TREM|nr:unnamed protein product [Schistosoma curassoni]